MDITVLASGSTGNCYHISDGKTRLLLDAGIPIRRIRVGCKFRLHQVSGCLVTHCHGDHSKAVKDLLCACVPVYLPEGEAQALSLTAAGRPLHCLRKEADGYGAFPIGTFRILPFRVEHDTPEPVGYLIGSAATGEKLLYLADYIEDTRTFEDCVKLREYFYTGLEKCADAKDRESLLSDTLILSFDMTIRGLIDDGTPIHQDTFEARNYLIEVKEFEQ